jgi:quercetin dioxygenase-like cupin family protein
MHGAAIFKDLLNMSSVQHTLDWTAMKEPGREGVQIVPLYDTSDTGEYGPSAAIVRYLPGAEVKPHRHPSYELIFVLEGELINDSGIHGPGTLEICPPGSVHGLSSRTGCVFLVVWERPVTLVTPASEERERQWAEALLDYGS